MLWALVLLIYSLKYIIGIFQVSFFLNSTFYEVIPFCTINFIWVGLLFLQVLLSWYTKNQTFKMDKKEDDGLLYQRALCFIKGLNTQFIHSFSEWLSRISMADNVLCTGTTGVNKATFLPSPSLLSFFFFILRCLFLTVFLHCYAWALSSCCKWGSPFVVRSCHYSGFSCCKP